MGHSDLIDPFLARFKSKSVLEIFGTLGHFGAFWGFGIQKNVKNCWVQNSFHETGIIFHIGSFLTFFFLPKPEYQNVDFQLSDKMLFDFREYQKDLKMGPKMVQNGPKSIPIISYGQFKLN